MSGRIGPDPGFSADTGESDPGLASALAVWRAEPAREPEVLRALAGARVLVPVVARRVAPEPAGPAEPPHRQPTTMALAILVGTDGRRALPVFSGLAAMAAWDPAARPVPVDARRAASSALAEDAHVLVLDVAGPDTYVVAGSSLRRLADGDPMLPAYDDPSVARAVAARLEQEPAVRAAWLLPADGADARLAFAVEPGCEPAVLDAAARRVAAGLSSDDAVRAAVTHGLEIAVLAPGQEPDVSPVFLRRSGRQEQARPRT